jgi:signal transduction histidine kinase
LNSTFDEGDTAQPLWGRLDRVTARDALRLSVVLVLVVGLGNYAVGTEISFSIFYFIPISVAAWHVGRSAGYWTAVASALLWLANDLWNGRQPYSAAWIPYWNAFMRLMIFVIVVTLLTHWKRALAAERRAHLELDRARREQLQLKDQLLSNVSHELRTPLTAAHQFVAILLEGIAGPVNDRQKEYLEIAQRNLKQLSRMIGDLLDTARGESGKLSIDIGRVRIDDLVAETVRAAGSRATERGVELVLEAAAPVPEVLADAGRVRQVVTNLLDNALKFTPSGGRVTVSVTAGTDDGFVRVSVEDTGKGISAEAQERLFQRLYQADTDDDSSRRGLGLGLYISREIVNRQGGRIWAESEVGRGSAFHFTLPLAPEEG